MRYRFADEALTEYIAAGRYYNRQVPGLGDALADAVEAGIATIRATPFVGRIVEDGVRRFLVERFPYGIYCTVEDDRIVIWAVRHLRRDPDYWRERRTRG